MVDWSALTEGFRYDLWANRLWLECLDRKHAVDRDRKVFGHLLSAQKGWLSRVAHGISPTSLPIVDQTIETMTAMSEEWVAAIESANEDRIVNYNRTTGEPNSSLLSEIAMHVVNHGTYHRGELRGLCLARGDDDFPETDRILYVLSTKS